MATAPAMIPSSVTQHVQPCRENERDPLLAGNPERHEPLRDPVNGLVQRTMRELAPVGRAQCWGVGSLLRPEGERVRDRVDVVRQPPFVPHPPRSPAA